MPRLETGLSKHLQSRPGLPPGNPSGYSLIELLVVIVIAGLLTTLVVLRFGGNREAERAEHSLDQLAASIELLCDQALLNSQVAGIRLSNEGYDFWILIDNRWQQLPGNQAPRARSWPEGIPVEIEIDQRRLRRSNVNQPQLWCSALEPMAALEVRLGRGDLRQSRRWSADEG